MKNSVASAATAGLAMNDLDVEAVYGTTSVHQEDWDHAHLTVLHLQDTV